MYCPINSNNIFIGFLTTISPWSSTIAFAHIHYLFPWSVSFHHLSNPVRALVSVEAETSPYHPFACRRALLVQHHHHHEINEEAGTSTACPLLACSAQQHAEAAIATALVQAEEAACRIAGGGLGLGLARRRCHSEVGVEASAGGQCP